MVPMETPHITSTTLSCPAGVDMALVCGPADAVVRQVQAAFDARITVRGDSIELYGDPV